MDRSFFLERSQITKFQFSRMFGLHTISKSRIYQTFFHNYYFLFDRIKCMTDISIYCPQDNVTPIILSWITDMTANSAHEETDAEQQNSTTNSAKLMLHSAAANLFSLPKSCTVIKVPRYRRCSWHTSVETKNTLVKLFITHPWIGKL